MRNDIQALYFPADTGKIRFFLMQNFVCVFHRVLLGFAVIGPSCEAYTFIYFASTQSGTSDYKAASHGKIELVRNSRVRVSLKPSRTRCLPYASGHSKLDSGPLLTLWLDRGTTAALPYRLPSAAC